jgi:hypothetical protein
MQMQSLHPPPRFACTSDSTVYVAVADTLQRMGWLRTDDVSCATLLLADGRKKGGIPWDDLSQRALPLAVNAFPKFSCITLKSMMARTIRITCAVQPQWLPLTFIVYAAINVQCSVVTQRAGTQRPSRRRSCASARSCWRSRLRAG